MMKNVLVIGFTFLVFLSVSFGCKRQSSLPDLADNLVSSIKTKDANKYYSLFPNSEQVAKYGIFAYGLYAISREEMNFWMRPYTEYSKSVDSLEKIQKPVVINQINQMFDDFHSTIPWDKVEIIKIDTTETRIEKIGNLEDKKSVKSVVTNMKVNLLIQNKKYELVCRDVMFIENEGWFLRNAHARVLFNETK
jgi:hypothetical protein